MRTHTEGLLGASLPSDHPLMPHPPAELTQPRTKMMAASARRSRAAESFRTAADCIGPIESGLALFAVTRGQFSMIDAVLHCLDQVGPSSISLWTWTIAEYEVDKCIELLDHGAITEEGRLLLNGGDHARVRANRANERIIDRWRERFGPDSVRDVMNHAKIARVASLDGRFRLLLRGSMNLNFNPRFEQLDITEGGPDYDLVEQLETELPILRGNVNNVDRHAASRTGDAFPPDVLARFLNPPRKLEGFKTWTK